MQRSKNIQKGIPDMKLLSLPIKEKCHFLDTQGGDYKSDHLIISRVRNFIHSTEQDSLSVQVDGSNFFLVERVGLVFLTGIGLLLITCPVVSCIFDKDLNQLILTRRWLILQKTKKYSLDLVVDIKLEKSNEKKDTFGLIDKVIPYYRYP